MKKIIFFLTVFILVSGSCKKKNEPGVQADESLLTGLSLSANIALSPAFSKQVYSYNAVVNYSISEITLTPAFISGASVKINGTAVTSGAPSHPIALIHGNNFITIEAISADGLKTKTTNLTILQTDFIGGTFQNTPLSLSGTMRLLAGSGGGYGSVDGIGTNARFYRPVEIVSDGINLYIADSGNHTIRKIVIATGEVSTLAGSPCEIGSADGIGTAASFNFPEDITTDGSYLFLSDLNNHTIRKIVIQTGEVTTLPVQGYFFTAITTDGTKLYVTESNNIQVIE